MQVALDSQSDWLGSIARWGELWGVPGIERRVQVTFSARLRRSLGRCAPTQGTVRLNVRLLKSTAALLVEVLCHELAHVAVYELHSRRCRPHGPEWAALMRAAGFEPRARARLTHDVSALLVAPRRGSQYEHRCPVCRAVRFARRPVRQWRCVACLTAGLDGHLLISKWSNSSPPHRPPSTTCLRATLRISATACFTR